MRRTIPAAAALLLVGGLTACGSSDATVAAKTTSRTSPSPSTVAASRTRPALFASMTTAMAKAKTATVSFTSKISGQQVQGHGGFRFSTTDVAADMSVVLPGLGQGRVILLPRAFYLRLGEGAGLTTTGRPWLEIKTDGKGGNPLVTSLAPVLGQLRAAFDPQSNLGMLRAATTVKKAGAEQVDGVSTTKYTATVDLAKAARVASGPLADRYRAMVSSGVRTLNYSLWVGRDNLPRKFATVVPTAQGDVSASGTYRNWGKRLVIKAPPAGQIAATPVLPGS
jgi:hypothetical protein